jgi:hypothetical protein
MGTPGNRMNAANPGRINWNLAAICLVALSAFQVAAGTSAFFIQLVFLCCVAGLLTVNLLGGAAELAGFCVLMLLLKLVFVGQLIKAFFGESAEASLVTPYRTLMVILAGFGGMVLASLAAGPFRFRSPALKPITDPATLKLAGLLTYAAGTVCCLGSIAAGGEDGLLRVGGMAGLMRQLSFASKLSIVFTTAAVILRTERRHSLQVLNAVPMLTLFGYGLLTASKQAMLDPFLLYGLTVIAFRHRLKVRHGIGAVALVLVAQLLLFPFAQAARNVIRVFGLKQSLEVTGDFISAFYGDSGIRDQLESANDDPDSNYFNRPAGLWERFGMIKTMDMLVLQTEAQGQSDWDTIQHGFNMLIPRFINPDKPAVNTGNYLGHKAGLLGDEDEGTQVSFGFIADSYSAFRWWGAVLIPFCIVLAFTVVYRWLTGPLWGNVWTVYLFAEFQHSFSEQTIASMIITICLSPLSYLAIYWGVEFCRKWLSRGRLFSFDAVTGQVASRRSD